MAGSCVKSRRKVWRLLSPVAVGTAAESSDKKLSEALMRSNYDNEFKALPCIGGAINAHTMMLPMTTL